MESLNKVNIANFVNHHRESEEQMLKTRDKQEEFETDELMKHSATDKISQYRCSACGKYFNTKKNRDKHFILHKGENVFSCDECGRDFASKGSLKAHQMIHTDEKPFRCKVCGQRFTLRGNLEAHSLTHTGEKPFKCTVCKKRFSQLGNMRTHEMTHTGEKPYICNICGKGFTQKGNLKSHALIHTGNKPYICEICGKSFAQKGNFETHRMKHTSDSPGNLDEDGGNLSKLKEYFSCGICRQKFKYECKLDAHKLTHSEEKPFTCNICDKGFKTNSSLKTHGTKEHKEQMLSFCNICGEEFESNDQLKIHLKKHTEENTKSVKSMSNDIPIPSKKCSMKQNQNESPLIFKNIKKNTFSESKAIDPNNIYYEEETGSQSICAQRSPDLTLICDFIEEVERHPKSNVQTENRISTLDQELYVHPEKDNQTYNKHNSQEAMKMNPKEGIHTKQVYLEKSSEVNNMSCNFQEEHTYPETEKYTYNINAPTRDSFFNCSVCGMAFNYMSELDHHMNIHFSEESIIDTVLNW